MTKSFKKVSALLLGLTMLGGVFGGALLARDPGGVVVNAATQDTTITFSEFMSDKEEFTSHTVGDVTFAITYNEGDNPPMYYNNGTALRVYAQNVITITSAADLIVSVNFDVAQGNWSSIVLESEGAVLGNNQVTSTGVASISLKFNASSGNIRFSSVTITTSDTADPNAPTVSITGTETGVVGRSVELTSSVLNFTSPDLTYAWTVAEGSETIASLTNANTGTATVNLLAEGQAIINLSVTAGDENATASITIKAIEAIGVKEAKALNEGQTCYVVGVVFASYGGREYVTDEDGTGLQIGTSGLNLNFGDEVLLDATIGSYNGVKQFSNATKVLSVLSTDNVPTPRVVSLADLTDDNLADYVAFEDAVYKNSAGTTTYFDIPNGDSRTEISLYGSTSSAGSAADELAAAIATWEANVTTVTLAGPLSSYNGNYQVQLAEGTSFEVDGVATFARKFLATELCDNGLTAPDAALWAGLKTAFDALDVEEQAVLREATGNEQGNVVEQAMRRYDYIMEKYGTDRYENFIAREITPASNVVDNFFGSNDNLTIILVVTITLVSLSILIGFRFYLNKRKSNK